jgi:Leucine-rich repeat (LRR) protein
LADRFEFNQGTLQPAVSQNGLFEPFIYKKTNILPRQARDKHRGNSKTKGRFPQVLANLSALTELSLNGNKVRPLPSQQTDTLRRFRLLETDIRELS